MALSRKSTSLCSVEFRHWSSFGRAMRYSPMPRLTFLPRKLTTAIFCFSAITVAAVNAQAHEFWFVPIGSTPVVGEVVPLRLEVGEFFEGDAAGFSIPKTAALRHFSNGIKRDLRAYLSPNEPEAEVLMEIDAPGTHLVSFDSEPQYVTLSADRFHAYLHDEGLDFVKIQREAQGKADQPGRERYWRNVKTLIYAGPWPAESSKSDLTYATKVGQRLELTPMSNPVTLQPGDPLNIHVAFDSRPLAGALVKAWHKYQHQLVTLRVRTASNGQALLHLPYPGEWMVSVVHMEATHNVPDVDWDSYWGSLTFSVRRTSPTRD